MQLQGSVAKKAALTLLLADVAFGEPLTTIHPCKEASNAAYPPITVTSQYQPVSTCQPTTACIKGKCSTIFPFTTYPFVSTVVPCAWNGESTQKSTVTDVTQPFRVSEHHETLTTITAAPTGNGRHWVDWLARKKPETKSITLYETVTKRAMAPFNECGGLAIPGWEGSGLCKKCENLEDGSRAQLLDVVECRSGVDAAGKGYEKCAEWFETWISRPAPTSTVTASARCSSKGNIPSAGTYTWTFPQTAPPVTITAPPRTVTITITGQKTVTVEPKSVYTIPGRNWNAYVTKIFSGPTTFNFNVYITKVIIFNIPNYTQPAGNTRHIPVPTGSRGQHGDGWWPLPPNKDGGDSYYGGGQSQGWADWSPETKTATVTRSNNGWGTYTSTTTYTSSLGPIGYTTSTSSSTMSTSSTSSYSLSLGPIEGTTTSSSSTFSLSSTTESTSSTFSLGPIDQGTTTTTSTVSTTSGRAIDSPIEGTTTSTSSSLSTTSSASVSLGPIDGSTTSSSSLSTTSSSSVSLGPIDGSTTSSSSLSTTSSSSVSDNPIDASTTTTSSTSSFFVDPNQGSTTSSSTSSATTTAAVAPICNLNVDICLNAQLITASTVVTQGCPLGIGLLCTVNQLLDLVPQLLNNNPNVLSTVIGNNQVLGLSITPQQVQAGILDGSLTSVCNILGTTNVVVNDPTCPINPTATTTSSSFTSTSSAVTTTSSASLTSFTSSSTTSSASVTTTTAAVAAPVCDVTVSICPNSAALAGVTITTVACPLLGGLLCTVNQLLSLVPQVLQSNPNVLSVVLGDNQALGLNITPQQVQALVLDGTLTSTCTALQQINVRLFDPTCPINPGTTTTSASVATTTSAPPAATTTAATQPLVCSTVVQLCAGQTLQDVGLQQVTCSLAIPALCSLVDLATDVTNACVSLQAGGCLSAGRIGTGLNILGATGLVGTQSVAQIQAAVGAVQNCQPGGQTLTLSDPGCPAQGILKRRGGLRHGRAY